MKKPSSLSGQPARTSLFLWRGMSWPGSERARKALFVSLIFLILVLLVFTWITLTRQLQPISSLTPATSPISSQVEPPRRDSSLVYDPLQHVVLLFGGTLLTSEGVLTNETWSWNGRAWQQLHPRTSPPALQGKMVYDSASQQVILFLNQVLGGGTVVNEMWTWNGSNWHQLQPALMPEVISESMAYDAARSQVLLFGDETPASTAQNGPRISATWSWNGTAWQELHPSASPAPRTGAALAYDGGRQQIVLYGGITADGLSTETWLWNGTTWQQLQHIALPSPRQDGSLVYDGTTHQLLLFGGLNTAGTQPALSDTWNLQSNGWVRVSPTGAPTDLYESTTYDDATHTVLVYAAQGSITKNGQANSPAPISQTWIWNGTTWQLLL